MNRSHLAIGLGVLFQLALFGVALAGPDFDPRGLVAHIFFDLGLALVLVRESSHANQQRFAATAVRVEGAVIAREAGGSTGNARHIVVEYVDESGKKYRVTSSGASTSAPAVGETATVFFQAGSPYDGKLEFDWKLRASLMKIGGLIGIGVGAIGIVGEAVRAVLG